MSNLTLFFELRVAYVLARLAFEVQDSGVTVERALDLKPDYEGLVAARKELDAVESEICKLVARHEQLKIKGVPRFFDDDIELRQFWKEQMEYCIQARQTNLQIDLELEKQTYYHRIDTINDLGLEGHGGRINLLSTNDVYEMQLHAYLHEFMLKRGELTPFNVKIDDHVMAT